MLVLIISIIVVLIISILYSNLKIKLNFSRYDEDDNLTISVSGLYGIFKYTKNISIMDLIKEKNDMPALKINTEVLVGSKDKKINKDKSIYNMYEIERIINNYKTIYIKYQPYIRQIKKNLVFNNISWSTKVGTGDAAETAILTGSIWAIKAFIIIYISKNYKCSNLLVNVIPDYNINTFETSIDCIFSIKLGYIINVDIKTLLKEIKDGVKNE